MAEEKKELPELTADAKKVLEMVEKMTVLELADLVKTMEDKFGVSAAAPVAMATAPAAAAEEVEEKSNFNIVLKDGGSDKIAVIKAVRAITEMGLKEAKDLVDTAPQTIKEEVAKEEAEEMKKQLEAAGATVELE
ncbi:MAG: 50S ribosomal protein L7/L12 [Candidatus Dojkabacteria bacterium]|nr:50S ribosomal protein L7/L12 [Candidatus Dojkabacteria bacterium]